MNECLMIAVKRGDELVDWTIRKFNGSITDLIEAERRQRAWGLTTPDCKLVRLTVAENRP